MGTVYEAAPLYPRTTYESNVLGVDFTTSCLVFVSRGREESGVQGRRGTTLPLHVSSTGRGTTLPLHVVLTAHETIELTNDVAHVAAP